jgi:hypothetical protein
VRHFTLIDPDGLSDSNITRVYGSSPCDIGQPKVRVLAKHLRSVADDTDVEEVAAMLTLRSTAEKLTRLDVLFGCTDDNAGRLVLSRAATYLLTPVIDCGVLLTSDADGILTGIDGRVTVLTPGHACLVCRGRIDVGRAAAELLTPAERIRRADDGYAPALLEANPGDVAARIMLGKFDPATLRLFEAVRERARKFAEDQLKTGMFRSKIGNFTAIAAESLNTEKWLTHGQMIGWEAASQIGLTVEYLKPSAEEWQTYWRLYCLQRLAIKDHEKLFESEYASLSGESSS